MSWGAISGQLARIERQAEQRAVSVDADQWYQFLVSASCPPSTGVHIRSGIISPSATWGYIMLQADTPTMTCDFTNTTETGLLANFTNANWYLGIVLCYYGAWLAYRERGAPYTDQPYTIITDGIEYETAAEAEASINLLLNGTDDWLYYLFPLWAIVLRNDGNTGIDGAVLPVDAVNRGRSYLWRDARPRHLLVR